MAQGQPSALTSRSLRESEYLDMWCMIPWALSHGIVDVDGVMNETLVDVVTRSRFRGPIRRHAGPYIKVPTPYNLGSSLSSTPRMRQGEQASFICYLACRRLSRLVAVWHCGATEPESTRRTGSVSSVGKLSASMIPVTSWSSQIEHSP